jgi:hypothetical protein
MAGFLLALISASLGRGRLLVAIPVALSLICLYSHFGLSAEMAEIRGLSFGPDGNPDIASRYSLLHRISLGLYIGVSATVTLLIGLHAKADAESIEP